jgi:hypothetical protein
MGMRSRIHARVDDGVGALDNELGACKSQQFANVHVLSGGILCKERRGDEALPKHGGDSRSCFSWAPELDKKDAKGRYFVDWTG